MVDVVVNHMAYVGCGTCVDYSTLQPFNQVCDSFPLVDPSYRRARH